MVVENSNDLLLIFGGIGALFASIMGAVKMSRCTLIKCGCCETAFLKYFFVQEKTKNMVYIATMPRKTKKRTCKRRRVRKNPDGSLNQKDMEYNKKCEQKYMFADNPWMKQVLSSKKPKGYDKYLKHLVKKRIKTLKKK